MATKLRWRRNAFATNLVEPLPQMGEILNPPLPDREEPRYTFETRGSDRPAEEEGDDMAITRQVDLLEPIDLAEHLGKVELYLGQVCQIAGISKMQLDYWTNKAQIPTKGKKQRIYDIDALETVMLIKQAKDKGLNLGAAIDAARRFREAKSDDRRLEPQNEF
jgi:hypothetical protein